MKKILALLCFVVSLTASAQDSTAVWNHEIGFNTVSLIKQVISNNPSATLEQLPYDVFYNLYSKDKIGFRLGLGLVNRHESVDITGQMDPRTTDQLNLNIRAGVSYNFVKSGHITLNGFADFVTERFKRETANTFTSQSIQSPIENNKLVTTDRTTGYGAQVGVGVKYNIYKHLSIYAEVPMVFLSESVTSDVTLTNSSGINNTYSSSDKSSTRIIIPTTIYLVLRF